MSPLYISRALLGVIVSMWIPTLVFAATLVAARGDEPLALDPLLMGFSCLLATMAGGTTLAIRLNTMVQEPSKPLVKPWLFCGGHMGGSWCASTVAFLIGRQQSWDVWSSLIFVFVMGFAGARGMETLVEKYLGVLTPKL